MDALYSTTLLLAIVSVAGAWIGLALRLLAAQWAAPPPRVIRFAAWLALLFTAGSGLIHFLGGHPPGSQEALGPLEFFRIHPAFVVVAGLAGVAVYWQRRGAGGSGGKGIFR